VPTLDLSGPNHHPGHKSPNAAENGTEGDRLSDSTCAHILLKISIRFPFKAGAIRVGEVYIASLSIVRVGIAVFVVAAAPIPGMIGAVTRVVRTLIEIGVIVDLTAIAVGAANRSGTPTTTRKQKTYFAIALSRTVKSRTTLCCITGRHRFQVELHLKIVGANLKMISILQRTGRGTDSVYPQSLPAALVNDDELLCLLSRVLWRSVFLRWKFEIAQSLDPFESGVTALLTSRLIQGIGEGRLLLPTQLIKTKRRDRDRR
jgi:hypothetical protein